MRAHIRHLAPLFATVAVGLSACGSDGDKAKSGEGAAPGEGKPPIVLGTKNFTEQYVLGQLYKQALEAKGFKIQLKNDIGSSEIVDRALTSGGIDMYPEYTGVIVTEIARAKERTRSPEETYARAKKFEARRGFAVLKRSPGSDVLAPGVKPDYARKHGLETTGDLEKVGSFTFGGAPENKTRFQGVVGMRKVYGLDKIKFVALKIEDRYEALDKGEVDVIGVFSTEGQLANKRKYKVLTDPEGIFGFQNIAPVVNEKVLVEQGPEFERTLDAVTVKLTNDVLRDMNAAVDLDKRQPADVAREFLERHGML